MTDTRSAGGQTELAGHLIGGYRTLAERLAERITALGGQVLLDQPAEQLHSVDGAVTAVTAGGRRHAAELAVLTTPLPLSGRLLRGVDRQGSEPADQRAAFDAYVERVEQVDGYLGVICLLLMLRRPLSPYYTLYLADRRLPFTAVVETTNLIDPALVGGNYLVYLPKYVDPQSDLFQMPDELVCTWFLSELKQIYPDFSADDIVAAPVFRAPHVEPLHPMGMNDRIPAMQTPLGGLWLGSTKHFYPRLNNGDAVARLGHELVQRALAAAPASHAVERETVTV
jgi:protoporphyrinogen oxidase